LGYEDETGFQLGIETVSSSPEPSGIFKPDSERCGHIKKKVGDPASGIAPAVKTSP
jgi:hypothetical protein